MENNETCKICLNPLKFFSIGTCNHRDVCLECYLRRKRLYLQIDCPMCREPVINAIVTADPQKKYKDYVLEELKFLDEFGIYLDEEAENEFQNLSRLWQLKCPYCDSTDFEDVNQLKHHTRSVHKLEFCSVCLKDRKVFLQEQKLYSQKDIRIHLKSGDRDTLITHAYCQFCNEYKFDQEQLWQHLHKDHETCFLCNKKEGRQFQYYKNYRTLEDHFRNEHHICEHPDCLEKRFVVFSSSSALKVHEVNTHIPKSHRRKSDAKISMDYGHSHNHHNNSTQNAQRVEQVRPTAQDFPTLGTETSHQSESDGKEEEERSNHSGPFLSDWSRVVAHVQDEFPALAGEIIGTQQLNGWASRPVIAPDKPVQPVASKAKAKPVVPSGPDFPSLGSSPSKAFNQNWGKPEPHPNTDKDGFLRLGKPNSSNTPTASSTSNNNRNAELTSNDFPSFGSSNVKKPTWGAPVKSNTAPASTPSQGSQKNGKKPARESKKEETFFFGKK
eukprot:TRINITY_DN7718_c0_g1_i1.p1 TRINITY_DN7718_c0_g1~~TRINITY_DN7718_c0_g1_i1.p1  ORF type:complete len:498 (+),score=125.16 TRINITY_DN7718_c0_g1_i1:120-1613(+)